MIRLAALALAAVAAPLAAQAPTAFDLQAGLAGKWTGALGYRDYQSDKLFELPVNTEIRVQPDGATIVRTSEFDDGPRVGRVYITSAVLYDLKAGTATTATLRKGRPVETATDRVTVRTTADPTKWSVVYERDGTDDDKPARIRTTETRDGNALLSVKEVMPVGTTAWRFRNQTRLTRTN